MTTADEASLSPVGDVVQRL